MFNSFRPPAWLTYAPIASTIAWLGLSSIHGVTRIWLFGSAARSRPLDWRSDLDFAVEGLPPGREYQAWSELDERLSYPLDLVRCEDASPLLLSEIQKGIVLYET